MKTLTLILTICLLMAAGCSPSVTAAKIETDAPTKTGTPSDEAAVEAAPNADGAVKAGYYFDYNGTPVYLGDLMENVLAILGPELNFYEAPSCAYDGMAKMYVYGGFELATYIINEGDADRLYSLTFLDDSVATAEGAYIGQSYDDMVALYSDGYEEIPGGAYLYNKDGTVLSFTVPDGEITVIQYYVQDIYG